MNASAAVLILLLLPLQDKEESKDPEFRQVTLNIEDQTITEVLNTLRKQTGIPIEYRDSARKFLDPDKTKVSIKVEDVSLHIALTLLLKPRGLTVNAWGKNRIVILLGY